MQQNRLPPSSPRRTMVSGGPGVGLHDRMEVIDERTGLLRPDATGPITGSPSVGDKRRASAGSAVGMVPTPSTMGNRKRSATSMSSLTAGPTTGPGWKLKYQDFVPDMKVSSGGNEWETQESFS
jgi:hypothetical protein